MANAIVVFGTTSGNTELLAESVSQGLKEANLEVAIKNVVDTAVDQLKDYDLVVLGCPTYEEGDLQEDFTDFYEAMRGLSLKGKKAAVFGPGSEDMYPETFCHAVDILEERLKACDAEILDTSLKINTGEVGEEVEDEAREEAKAWAADLANSL